MQTPTPSEMRSSTTCTPCATALVLGQAAQAARTGDALHLAQLLRGTREHTLELHAAYADALGDALAVPCQPQLNPPLWELGHIGWFQEYWIGRNRQRTLGCFADPGVARGGSHLAHADALYNSSDVPHDSRWSLPLPSPRTTLNYLQHGLNETLDLLAALPAEHPQKPFHAGASDDALYFFRLVLFHEAMHAEAALYSAQALGLPLTAGLHTRMRSEATHTHHNAAVAGYPAIRVPAQRWQLGHTGAGFAFDNELSAHAVEVPAFEIDARAVRWADYLAFADDGGYTEPRLWSAEGWHWRFQVQQQHPRYLRRSGSPSRHGLQWECQRFGQWQALDPQDAAVHLSWYEADAWCRWAGRSLPTEAQWECAALSQGMGSPDFHWGDVWEWTASRFDPYPGFMAHPYRDYSAPWFGSRPVLRGASCATLPIMAHPVYRNYFTPERNDLHAGFRSSKILTK